MIKAYLNQSAGWQANKHEPNQYNESTYADPVSIPCRFEYKRRMVRNKQGQEVISEATMFTEKPVKPDDLITFDNIDWVVITVANEVGLNGSVAFYEVMM